MELFDIAGLKINMNCEKGLIFDRSRAYLSADQNGKADFYVGVPEDVLEERHKAIPQLTRDECEYVYAGEMFYYKLLNYDGILLHASAVEKDGYAYLFSAKSGTGKSTHTHLWMQVFDNVKMINDDKPALRKIDGKFFACGTPFSGKNDESSNICVPIKAIVFLERAEENSIERISAQSAIPLFMSQTVRPSSEKYMVKMLTVLDMLLKEVPVFKLKCNISEDAARTAYEGIENILTDK